MIRSDGKAYSLRSGISIYPATKPPINLPFEEFVNEIDIKLLEKRKIVEYVDYSYVLERYLSGENLFVQIEIFDNSNSKIKYILLAPLEYLNVEGGATENTNHSTYLQPVIGPLLYPDNDKYLKAYYVGHIHSDDVKNSEVIKNKPEYLFSMNMNDWYKWQDLHDEFRNYKDYLEIDEYYDVEKVKSSVRFFLYK